MKKFVVIILLSLIFGQDLYEDLLKEKVSDEYCANVIGNITGILKEGYIYLDYLKAPKQPEGKEDYIEKVDLIAELNEISKTNRTFYEFYADIQNVLNKARDGHLSIMTSKTPKNISFGNYYFCIPFYYYVKEIFDEKNNTNDTFLTIYSFNSNESSCVNHYSNETIERLKKLNGKRILKINGLDPYEYLEEMGKKGLLAHSSQCRYIFTYNYIDRLYLAYYPLKKEELNVSIEFEGEEEEFKIDYEIEQLHFFSQEFKEYYMAEKKKYFKNNIPLPRFEEMELNFKIKKGLINLKNGKNETKFWELQSDDKTIQCRVDTVNEFNVLLQTSFSPDDFDNYEDIMYKCFSKFYSNNYKIIIIEYRNGGGYSELCVPFTQYLRPKILKPSITTMKSTPLSLKSFFINDENLNPETCFPYTEKDNILDGEEDIYDDGIDKITHQKTKDINVFNIYERKIMEMKRREYLLTNNTKKPTEILVFTDGYSFSCTSVFIRGLQVHGHGIIVGYNSRPDLTKIDFDASQSNSAVETFTFSEFSPNLDKLGFSHHITFFEEFDPNDKGTPQTPMEFQIYPVDEISDIYVGYRDERYDRFINKAKAIFDEYNDLDNGRCNPDNKYLYYETDKCDSILKIDKAHGGYVCGSDGKWNKTKCIAAYCDLGYILSDDRTECIRDTCEDITLKEIPVEKEEDFEYIIEPNNTYIFTINKENYSYYFYSEFEKFFYILNDNHILEAVKNGTEFKINNKIYINYFVNITDNSTIKIKVEKKPDDSHNKKDDKDGLSTGHILLIILGAIIVLAALVIIIIILKKKNKQLTNTEIEDKAQQLNPL